MRKLCTNLRGVRFSDRRHVNGTSGRAVFRCVLHVLVALLLERMLVDVGFSNPTAATRVAQVMVVVVWKVLFGVRIRMRFPSLGTRFDSVRIF